MLGNRRRERYRVPVGGLWVPPSLFPVKEITGLGVGHRPVELHLGGIEPLAGDRGGVRPRRDEGRGRTPVGSRRRPPLECVRSTRGGPDDDDNEHRGRDGELPHLWSLCRPPKLGPELSAVSSTLGRRIVATSSVAVGIRWRRRSGRPRPGPTLGAAAASGSTAVGGSVGDGDLSDGRLLVIGRNPDTCPGVSGRRGPGSRHRGHRRGGLRHHTVGPTESSWVLPAVNRWVPGTKTVVTGLFLLL